MIKPSVLFSSTLVFFFLVFFSFTVVNVCACVCCTNTRLLGLCLLSVPDKKGNALGRSQKTERPWTLICHQHQRATWSCVVCSTHVDHVYLFTRTCRNYILFLQTGVLTPSHRRQTEIASASLEPRGGFGSRISKIKAPEVTVAYIYDKFSFHVFFLTLTGWDVNVAPCPSYLAK